MEAGEDEEVELEAAEIKWRFSFGGGGLSVFQTWDGDGVSGEGQMRRQEACRG